MGERALTHKYIKGFTPTVEKSIYKSDITQQTVSGKRIEYKPDGVTSSRTPYVEWNEEETFIWISNIEVDPEFARKNLGQLLMDEGPLRDSVISGKPIYAGLTDSGERGVNVLVRKGLINVSQDIPNEFVGKMSIIITLTEGYKSTLLANIKISGSVIIPSLRDFIKNHDLYGIWLWLVYVIKYRRVS